MKNILITGITGQDGIFLTSKLLRNKNNNIIGFSRSKNTNLFQKKLSSLGVDSFKNLKIINTDLLNEKELNIIFQNYKFCEIYNLSGPSSVYDSLNDSGRTYFEITSIFSNLINCSLRLETLPNFFQASSSEMFGDNLGSALNEDSILLPRSSYAEAKLINHYRVLELSNSYNWNIKSGIMFNHESEFRKEGYLFSKVIKTAKKIKNGELNELVVGKLSYERDWSFSGDIVEAIFKVTNFGTRPSYVIGSGTSHSIKDLIEIVFNIYELDWKKYTTEDNNLLRRNDPVSIISDPRLIKEEFGWKPKLEFKSLVERCVKKTTF